LSNYRDAIQFVFDKSIEGMDKGLSREELVQYVQLPKELAELDYIKPYYGNSEWVVRGIYNEFLGWFDGNASNLFPLPPKEEAQRIAKLAGGEAQLITQLHTAMSEQDYQWAAQISDYILRL